jgi:single-strand DNA-binding protein
MSRTKPAATTASEPAAAPETAPSDQVTLIGRLCADPVLRHTASGIAVTNLRIAVNHEDADTTFHSVVAWKLTAQAVCRYLKKGRRVEVIGVPRERTWTDRDGAERTSTEINAFRVQFLSRQQTAGSAETAAA